MRLALALAVLPALPAAAAIRPCYLDQMVAEAPTVVQVTGQEVGPPDAVGNCTLTGTVARSFRGHLSPGTRIRTTFACEAPVQTSNGVIVVEPGGPTRHASAEVAAAGAVEIHADEYGTPAGHGWGLLLLPAPTDAPAFRFEALADPGC